MDGVRVRVADIVLYEGRRTNDPVRGGSRKLRAGTWVLADVGPRVAHGPLTG
jgi:hypothetical protein